MYCTCVASILSHYDNRRDNLFRASLIVRVMKCQQTVKSWGVGGYLHTIRKVSNSHLTHILRPLTSHIMYTLTLPPLTLSPHTSYTLSPSHLTHHALYTLPPFTLPPLPLPPLSLPHLTLSPSYLPYLLGSWIATTSHSYLMACSKV